MILFRKSARGIVFWMLFASLACVGGCNDRTAQTAPAKTAVSSERTLAEELLALEIQYRDLPPEYFGLLQSVLNEGVAALGDNPAQPETPEEAIAASEAVARVFAKHNFFQPTPFQEHPVTLGEALTPKSFSDEEMASLLKFDTNVIRAEIYAPGQPIYLVDCDMGSLILMGVFDRLGWDTRLVKAPAHAFLRWRLPDGSTVNWDLANWASYEDRVYLFALGATAREQVNRGTYLRSLPRREARGEYISQIGSILDDRKKALALFEEAIVLAPEEPGALHELAWEYASNPRLAPEYSEVAVMHAHRAIAADISWRPRLGVLACAYAADHRWEMAEAIMTGYAKEFPESEPETVQHNLDRIKQKKLCGD